ncbi:MAG: hypothetical protein BWZ02_03092 [Lentisphaerae bacterium ADurb.BinA184]|nr:MAG: hypothetical protein BWZ02_03092 [Lentisphaerae bacterium ADurb.BinA184]
MAQLAWLLREPPKRRPSGPLTKLGAMSRKAHIQRAFSGTVLSRVADWVEVMRADSVSIRVAPALTSTWVAICPTVSAMSTRRTSRAARMMFSTRNSAKPAASATSV